MRRHRRPISRARTRSAANAPRPTLRSSTTADVPLATFLAMMLAAMSPSHCTVPVTSRSAYSSLSAGTMRSLWLTTATPMRSSWRRKSPCGNCTRNPGIDSSLSSVPPVWPRPRPDILPKMAPQAATSGASDERHLVPHTAAGVLVEHGAAEHAQVERLAALDQSARERQRLVVAQAAQDHRHEQRAGLVRGDGPAHHAVDERTDARLVELRAVALARDHVVYEVHSPPLTRSPAAPASAPRTAAVRPAASSSARRPPAASTSSCESTAAATLATSARRPHSTPLAAAARASGAADMPTTSPNRESHAASAGVSNCGPQTETYVPEPRAAPAPRAAAIRAASASRHSDDLLGLLPRRAAAAGRRSASRPPPGPGRRRGAATRRSWSGAPARRRRPPGRGPASRAPRRSSPRTGEVARRRARGAARGRRRRARPRAAPRTGGRARPRTATRARRTGSRPRRVLPPAAPRARTRRRRRRADATRATRRRARPEAAAALSGGSSGGVRVIRWALRRAAAPRRSGARTPSPRRPPARRRSDRA